MDLNFSVNDQELLTDFDDSLDSHDVLEVVLSKRNGDEE